LQPLFGCGRGGKKRKRSKKKIRLLLSLVTSFPVFRAGLRSEINFRLEKKGKEGGGKKRGSTSRGVVCLELSSKFREGRGKRRGKKQREKKEAGLLE